MYKLCVYRLKWNGLFVRDGHNKQRQTQKLLGRSNKQINKMNNQIKLNTIWQESETEKIK